MASKKIMLQFTTLTFCIAYVVSGILIILGHFGYRVYNRVYSLEQFGMNIPFAIYILSPAIASYIVLKKQHKITGIKEWLKTVFYAKNNFYPYLFVVAGLTLYFLIHMAVSRCTQLVLPFYTLFLSLPGGLIIGGLEESGWMFWHIPLFFIPGTNHGEGLINFWMFDIQFMSFRFFNGAIYKISGKSRIFMCVLFHTLFNAASPLFGTLTMTWPGTILANTAIILVSILTVTLYNKRNQQNHTLNHI